MNDRIDGSADQRIGETSVALPRPLAPSPTRKDVIVVGGGFAGLSAATALAKEGHRVTLLEGRGPGLFVR